MHRLQKSNKTCEDRQRSSDQDRLSNAVHKVVWEICQVVDSEDRSWRVLHERGSASVDLC